MDSYSDVGMWVGGAFVCMTALRIFVAYRFAVPLPLWLAWLLLRLPRVLAWAKVDIVGFGHGHTYFKKWSSYPQPYPPMKDL